MEEYSGGSISVNQPDPEPYYPMPLADPNQIYPPSPPILIHNQFYPPNPPNLNQFDLIPDPQNHHPNQYDPIPNPPNMNQFNQIPNPQNHHPGQYNPIPNPPNSNQNLNDLGANPNLNLLKPSWLLIQYGLSVGFRLKGLDDQRSQLLNTINRVQKLVQESEDQTLPHVNALKLTIDLYAKLVDTITQINNESEYSGICLGSVLNENSHWICDSTMKDLITKIHGLGWRGLVAIPSNMDGSVIDDLQEFVGSLTGLRSTVLDFQQQNVGGPNVGP